MWDFKVKRALNSAVPLTDGGSSTDNTEDDYTLSASPMTIWSYFSNSLPPVQRWAGRCTV